MAELAVGAALTLVHDVVSLLNKEVHFKENLRVEVRIFRSWLQSMQAKLSEVEVIETSESQRTRAKQVKDVVYDIEEVLDEFMLHAPCQYHRHELFNKAHDTAHSIRHRRQFRNIFSKMEDIKKVMNSTASPDLLFPGAMCSTTEKDTDSGLRTEDLVAHVNDDEEIVGFEVNQKDLIHQLENGESKCLSIALVGPGGSGKTTLVKNAYNNKKVQCQFHCHAWVHVSRSFKVEDSEKLLCSMLAQFCASKKERISSDGVNTLNKLRNYLQHRKFFLVLDDIWKEEHWKYIKNVLPSGSGGSRIIVTSRNKDVASCCVEHDKHIHDLSVGLPSPKDMDLFSKNAFRASGGKCPQELEELSMKIVRKCGGSPLAIVAVGTQLSRRQAFPSEWQKFHDNIGSEIQTCSILSIISKIILPSYKDLPSNLRQCFLYFSTFPEDYLIEREKLIRLWVSEQFVIGASGKTVEEIAEDYLNELIRRNLVNVGRQDFDGRVRRCRVQNLVLEFLVQKSKEENLVFVLTKAGATSTGGKVRHLSVHNACTTLSNCRDFGSVRSTLFFRWNSCSPSPVIKDLLHYCKFLRVLDLQDAPISKFPEDIVHLSLLRYLSLRKTGVKIIPNSIKKLSYLETLDLKKTEVTELPQKIMRLRNLRHLLVDHRNVKTSLTAFNSVEGVKMIAGIGALINLQKLSLLKLDKFGKIIRELGALTQLRKLGIVQLNEEHGKDLCTSVEKMKHLSTFDVSSISQEDYLDLEKIHQPPCYLQRLYLKGRLQRFPGWISTLPNLFRIRLMWSKLPESPLEALQALPNLIELQMIDAYTGGKLVFEARRFRKLKTLSIEQFDQLHTIEIREGALPELKKLTLCKCEKLMTRPSGIKYLKHVAELHLYAMQDEFITRIQKKWGNREQKIVRHIPSIYLYFLTENQSWSCKNLS